MKTVKKAWGEEWWIVNTDYCGKILTVLPGHKCSLHFHKDKKETFYVLEGELELELLDLKTASISYRKLKTGESLTLEPLTPHSFKTSKMSCKFIEFSTHHDDSDSYRITRST